MNAPDRSFEAAAIVEMHRDLFGSDDRRRGILYYVCEALNVHDGGRWGVLTKHDQHDFIPSDVIVWSDTREHFDILGGDPDRAIWQPNGIVANPNWEWTRATVALFAPGTAPGNGTPAPIDPPTPAEPPAETPPEPIDVVALLTKAFDPIVDAISDFAVAVVTADAHLTTRDNGALSELTQGVNNLTHQVELLRTEGVRVRLR